MDRSKLVAVVTGVISLLLAIGYLVLVQLLDFRGDMVPAPISTVAFTLFAHPVAAPAFPSMVGLSFF